MFRPLYYLGCKTSITPDILKAIDSLGGAHGRACDLFAGSGAVSAALARSRPVTAVDIQEYSRVICEAQLNPFTMGNGFVSDTVESIERSEHIRLLEYCLQPMLEIERHAVDAALKGDFEELVALIECPPLLFDAKFEFNQRISDARCSTTDRMKVEGLWGARNTTTTRYFGGVYFSYAQAIFLDAALLYASSHEEPQANTLTAVAISAASSLVNTIGKQFAQPVRPRNKEGAIKSTVVRSSARDRAVAPRNIYAKWLTNYSRLHGTEFQHEAIRCDYSDFLKLGRADFTVVYADPPYTRDHYSRFYHVLETMCLRDEPVISISNRNGLTQPSRGVYRDERHQSPFCVRSTAPYAFEELFSSCARAGLPLVLSYSPSEDGDGTHPRVVAASKIIELARQHYGSVEVKLIGGKAHNKHNKADLELAQREHAEMLLVCNI